MTVAATTRSTPGRDTDSERPLFLLEVDPEFVRPDPEPREDPEPECEVVVLAARIVVSPPVYASPLRLIKSPQAPRVLAAPSAPPAPAPAPAVPTEIEPWRRTRRPGRRALVGTAAVVVAAAGAAGATNLMRGGDPASSGARSTPRPAPFAGAIADKACLKEWNTTTSGDAAQLRVTLGQFTGALARVRRVSPLPGTLMQPSSCGLTVYDPATDAHAVFVAGVKDQIGYLDVTAYPRASQYGWPATGSQANVIIGADGSLRAK